MHHYLYAKNPRSAWACLLAASLLLALAPGGWAESPQVVKNPYANVNWDAVQQYKANFHSHTVYSDGRAEPEQLIRNYAEAGYHILCISDHDNGYNHRDGERDVRALYTHRDGVDRSPTKETSWPWTRWIDEQPSRIWAYGGIESSAFYPDLGESGMLAVRGAELSTNPHTSSIFNWCGWADRTQDHGERIECLEENDGLAYFAHPTHYVPGGPWEGRLADLETWEDAVEFFGEYIVGSGSMLGFEVRDSGDRLERDRELFDRLLMRYYPDHDIFIEGSDDTHGTSVADNASLTIVLAEELTEEAVRHALTNGHKFAGTRAGTYPVFRGIDVDEERNTITLNVENFEEITWYKDGEIHSTGAVLDYSEMRDAVLRFELEQDGGIFLSQGFYVR